MTAKEWDDAADLFEEQASGAETGYEDHELKARQYVAERLRSLAMFAQRKASLEEER